MSLLSGTVYTLEKTFTTPGAGTFEFKIKDETNWTNQWGTNGYGNNQGVFTPYFSAGTWKVTFFFDSSTGKVGIDAEKLDAENSFTVYVKASSRPSLYAGVGSSWSDYLSYHIGKDNYIGMPLFQTKEVNGETFYYATFYDIESVNVIFTPGNTWSGQSDNITTAKDVYYEYDGNGTATDVTDTYSGTPVYGPANLYILGLGGWAPNRGTAMTAGDNYFTYTGNFYDQDGAGYAYFSFTSALAEGDSDGDWDNISDYRYGAETNNKLVTAGNYSVNQGTNAFKIAQGNYTFKVTFTASNQTLNIVNNGSLDFPTIRFKGDDADGYSLDWTNGLLMNSDGAGIYTTTAKLKEWQPCKFDAGAAGWFGLPDDDHNVTGSHHSDLDLVLSTSTENIYVEQAGTYDITLDYVNMKVTFVKRPDVYDIVGDNGLLGGETSFANFLGMSAQSSGIYTLTKEDVALTAKTYEYKAAADNSYDWYSFPSGLENNSLAIPYAGTYRVTFTLDTNTTPHTLSAVAALKQTVSAAEYATFYYENAAFEIPEGVTAQTYKIDNGLKPSKTVRRNPTGQALVLNASAGSYYFPLITDGSEEAADSDNQLFGQDTDQNNYTLSGYKLYYLTYTADNPVGFYFQKDNGTAVDLKANKAYLKVPTGLALAVGYAFQGGGETTGISSELDAGNTVAIGAVYTLDGRKVAAQNGQLSVDMLPKGIYIVNGKKVVVK